ncbi:MAG: hypothetical protein WKI04_04065 [Ferruginibacter sp.]
MNKQFFDRDRNIYGRIEVCFPVYDEQIRHELKQIIQLQLADNTQAVELNGLLENIPVTPSGEQIRSQEKIYGLLKSNKAGLQN